MTLQQSQKWSVIRSKGHTHYIVVYGLIGRTILLLGTYALVHILSRIVFTYPNGGLYDSIGFWILVITMFLVGGLAAAQVRWAINEKRFTHEGANRT